MFTEIEQGGKLFYNLTLGKAREKGMEKRVCRDCDHRNPGILQDMCYGVKGGKPIEADDPICDLFVILVEDIEDETDDDETEDEGD